MGFIPAPIGFPYIEITQMRILQLGTFDTDKFA